MASGLAVKTKAKHLELKRGYIHEGVSRTGKRGGGQPGLFRLFWGVVWTDLFTQMSDYLQTHYDLNTMVIIANSDGGSGEANKFECILSVTRALITVLIPTTS